MRALLLASLLSILAPFSSSGYADSTRPRQIDAVSDRSNPNHETYRGYFFDLTGIADRQDFAAIVGALRHQIDIVESVGLSQRVLKFFHTEPILVDEQACWDSEGEPTPVLDTDTKTNTDIKRLILEVACYGPLTPGLLRSKSHGTSFWDNERWEWTKPTSDVDPVDVAQFEMIGVVMVRPPALDPQRPILLHELLHAYHFNVMPGRSQNQAIMYFYNLAKQGGLYPDDSYLLTNQKEFFAVTASVFLYGKDGPLTRANLREKQPDYFNYLVWLFGFDPDRMPIASTN